MRTAGYIEKKPVGGIEHDDGCKALAPSGNVVERARVFIRISFDGGELGMNGASVGQRHGEPQTERRRAGVHTRQLKGVGFLGVDRKRAAFRRAPGSDQPIRIEARQIDREPHALPSVGHRRSNPK